VLVGGTHPAAHLVEQPTRLSVGGASASVAL
jgi:hypothetical protein